MCTIHANSAREAITKLCTLPLLAGENVSHSFVVPTVASSVDLVVHIERDAPGPSSGRARSSPSRAGSRATSSRPPTCSSTHGGRLVRARRLAAARRAIHPQRFRPPGAARVRGARRPWRGRWLMGALVGLLAGIGGLLIWRSGTTTPDVDTRRGPRLTERVAELLAAGWLRRGPTAAAVRRVRVVAAVGGFVLVAGSATRPSIGFAFAGFAGYAPFALVRHRASASARWSCASCGRTSSTTWPPRCAPGMSLPEAVSQIAVGVRSSSAPRSPAFAADYRATGRFGECLDRLKDALADPIADRIIESMRVAREVGGTDLGRLLRTLSHLPARGRAHPGRAGDPAGLDHQRRASRSGRAVDRPRSALAATRDGHRLRLRCRCRRTRVGAAVSFAAYRVMLRIARLPDRGAGAAMSAGVDGRPARSAGRRRAVARGDVEPADASAPAR